MSNIYWAGKQIQRSAVKTLTITTAATDGAITVTVGGTKSVAITPADTNTTTTATALLAALVACVEGEFTEITWTASTNVITITGPTDGAPITVAKTDGGSNVTALATVTAPLSPYDYDDAANYVGAVLPNDNDTLIFENSAVPCLYNLSALTTKIINVIRRSTFTAKFGLPDLNARGYVEHRATRLETAGLTHILEKNVGDDVGQVRMKLTSASASTVTITGAGAAPVGQETVDLTGFASTSVLNVSGADVIISPATSDVSVIATILANDATVTVGPHVTTLTTIKVTGGQTSIQSTYGTLTMDRDAAVEVSRAAVGTTTTVDGGTLTWKSTGTFGTLTLGSDGAIDLSQAPAAIVPTAITVNERSAINDPAGRLTRTYAITFNRCGVQDCTLDLGTNYAAAIT